ncbi:MAG: hypothetical protein KDC80_13165 [Saprospiraceae bacterium]|nr:hypothetical protein [Saprospiraceae bacterium]
MDIQIPKSVAREVRTALAFYPELENVPIEFKFRKNIRKSTMLAQPGWSSFFKRKSQRKYIIWISEKSKISKEAFSTKDLPPDVLIGWFGHELGHIMDYETLSNWKLILFGIKYLLSEGYVKAAEQRADHFAIKHGMVEYILTTKNFILNHADISERYKNHIQRFYLSPNEIEQLVMEDQDLS